MRYSANINGFSLRIPSRRRSTSGATIRRAVASSSLAPRAVAERVTGGWRLSGRYSFSSGSTYASWAIIGAFLDRQGDAATIAYLLVPFTDIEIIDDWHVLGLAGTGSRSLACAMCSCPSIAACC